MVLVHHNPQLCFLQKVPWGSIFRNPRQRLFQTHNKPPEQCGKQHPWGTGLAGRRGGGAGGHPPPPPPSLTVLPCRERGAGLLPPLRPRALLGPRSDPVRRLRAVPARPGVRRLLQPPGRVSGEHRGRRAEPPHPASYRGSGTPSLHPPHGPFALQSRSGTCQRDAVPALSPRVPTPERHRDLLRIGEDGEGCGGVALDPWVPYNPPTPLPAGGRPVCGLRPLQGRAAVRAALPQRGEGGRLLRARLEVPG